MIFSRPWFAGTFTVLYVLLAVVAISKSAIGDEVAKKAKSDYKPKSPAELRRTLTPLQYRVTQNAATEPAFRNAYWDNKREGAYRCVVCGLHLFDSVAKFESGTGWPSFWKPVDADAIGTETDWKLLYPRTEVHCSRCEAHLGHVFKDGPPPTGLRYCLNSASLKFVAASKKKAPDERRDAVITDQASADLD